MDDAAWGEVLRRQRDDAEDQLRRLSGEFDAVVAASADSNADDEHDPEGSTIAFERSQLDALIHHMRRRIDDVDAALGRLDGGTFGACESCGRMIGAGRLGARPTARRCIACA